jgi:hypothetical protein
VVCTYCILSPNRHLVSFPPPAFFRVVLSMFFSFFCYYCFTYCYIFIIIVFMLLFKLYFFSFIYIVSFFLLLKISPHGKFWSGSFFISFISLFYTYKNCLYHFVHCFIYQNLNSKFQPKYQF